MNNKSDKMDRQGARTVSDLELKFNMGKSFAVAMGISDPSRMTLEDAKRVIKTLSESLNGVVARLDLAVIPDENGVVKSLIQFKSNNLVIESDQFTLNGNGDARFGGVLNGAIINTVDNDDDDDNRVVQLVDSSVQFYKNDEFIGCITGYGETVPGRGSVNGVAIRGGDTSIEGSLFLWFNEDIPAFNRHIYVDGIQTKTGFVKYNVGLTDRYMLFVSGLLMGIYSEIPADSPYSEITL